MIAGMPLLATWFWRARNPRLTAFQWHWHNNVKPRWYTILQHDSRQVLCFRLIPSVEPKNENTTRAGTKWNWKAILSARIGLRRFDGIGLRHKISGPISKKFTGPTWILPWQKGPHVDWNICDRLKIRRQSECSASHDRVAQSYVRHEHDH